jgi:hypothetical protein
MLNKVNPVGQGVSRQTAETVPQRLPANGDRTDNSLNRIQSLRRRIHEARSCLSLDPNYSVVARKVRS